MFPGQVAGARVGAGSLGAGQAGGVGQVLGVAVLGALACARASATGQLTGVRAGAFLTGLHGALVISGAALLTAAALTALATVR